MSAQPARAIPRRATPLPPDERRAALVAAALPLILEHGPGVSTRQIALAAGVAEGTIFRAFPDKDSLIRATVAAAFDPGAVLDELRQVDPAAALRPKLTAITRIVQARLTRVITLMASLDMHRPPDDDATGRAGRPTTSELVSAAVAQLLAPNTKQLRVTPGEAARLLRLLAFSGTHPRITDGQPLTAEEIVSVLLDGVLRHDVPDVPASGQVAAHGRPSTESDSPCC